MKTNFKILVILVCLLILFLALGSYFLKEPSERYETTRDKMDTYVTIILYHDDQDEANEIISKAYDRIDEIINIASRYNVNSELYELNQNGVIENPSNELKDMIEKSILYWNITDGAFDVTILPLLNLWNDDLEILVLNESYEPDLDNSIFSESMRNNFTNIQPPIYNLNETPVIEIIDEGWIIKSSWQQYSVIKDNNNLRISTKFYYLPYDTQQDYINQTLPIIGSDKITVSNDRIQIQPGMSITLDGIAKGYIVDEAMKILEQNGIKNAMIDAGGDILTLGSKPDEEKWIIGLRNPENKSDSLAEFKLSDQAITTSGNYERYFDEEADVGHIMDPKTGRSVYKCSSASIVTNNCTVADILSTAVFVLGPDKGLQLVESLQNTETIILDYEDPTKLIFSSGMDSYLVNR